MDIRCKHCYEPWDADELHELVKCYAHAGVTMTYDDVRKLFYQYGCEAFSQGWDGIMPTEATCKPAEQTEQEKMRCAGIEVMQELAGSDVDGLAADIADFEYIGLL